MNATSEVILFDTDTLIQFSVKCPTPEEGMKLVIEINKVYGTYRDRVREVV